VARLLQFALPPDPEAVREARRRVKALDDVPDNVAATAELVVSELVTNSLLHAGLGPDDAIEVTLRRAEDRLEVQVDDGDGFYGTRGKAPLARRPGGMGLRLIDALCDYWHAEAGRVVASIRM
jgi:serine/threonine-protein kinase RsbW